MLPSPSADVVFMNVEGGAVLLHTRKELYFGLNPVAAQVWEKLSQHDDVESLCGAIGGLYPDVDRETIDADVTELLGELESMGLLVASTTQV
jgi:hypothetical protein